MRIIGDDGVYTRGGPIIPPHFKSIVVVCANAWFLPKDDLKQWPVPHKGGRPPPMTAADYRRQREEFLKGEREKAQKKEDEKKKAEKKKTQKQKTGKNKTQKQGTGKKKTSHKNRTHN
jgi:hypothetical protein